MSPTPLCPTNPPLPGEPMGLLAGWGRLPLVVAESLKKHGYRVFCLGIRDHADSSLAEICDDFRFVGLAKLGAAIRYFQRNHVRFATMAGKVHKVILFQPFSWWKHFPDWHCLWTFYPHWISRTRDKRDDTLLSTVVDAYAKAGIHFAPATDFAPDLLVPPGHVAGPSLTPAQWKDVAFGWQLAKEMGRLDVGQAVAVKSLATIAVEAIEGTDECIRRAGQLCPSGGFTVVKVAKPQQDMRFDVPTVGTQTLTTLVQAGGRVLALEAGKTIVLDRQEMVRLADYHRISIVAVTSTMLEPWFVSQPVSSENAAT